MNNFLDTNRLVETLHILNKHQKEINNFYHSSLNLQTQGDGIEKIKNAFMASVSERRGASFNRGKEAVQGFISIIGKIEKEVNDSILTDPEGTHKILFEKIVSIPNIDQKIAAMFLKFVVVYLGFWSQIHNFLYVPIDRVVLKLLKEKLKIYKGPWDQSPSIKNPSGVLYCQNKQYTTQYKRFLDFQDELKRIALLAEVQRILIDELWLVGNIFCKEYPLCQCCWINTICKGKPFY